MAKIVKYFPLWQVVIGGKTYKPCDPPEAIEGLTDDEIEKLLQMGAIKRMRYSESDSESGGESGEESEDIPLEKMSYSDLKLLASDSGIAVPAGTSKVKLLELLQPKQ